MLKSVNKYLGYLFLISLFVGCENSAKNNNTISNLYQTTSIGVAKVKTYDQVYSNAVDSINGWIKHNLSTYRYQQINEWRLDSLISFNKLADKCVLAILIKSISNKESTQDGIDYFYGVKIMQEWYFFRGPSVVLPRQLYKKDIHTPLSFSKLHEIALKEIYYGYLTPEGEINEGWFEDIFKKSAGCSSCVTEADFEKYYLWLVANNWKPHPEYHYEPEKKLALP